MATDATPTNAAHLLRRAAWGGTAEEIENVVDRGIEATVDELLDPAAAPVVGEPLRRRGPDVFDFGALQTWFARLAATSPTPALERLNWFWTGHFATSIEKVEFPDLLHQQWVTTRRLGLGRFDDLLKAVSRDIAMNIWLDLRLSVVGKPNENFARELMELFSLGASNGYTQPDVVAAARAFTGYGVRESQGRPSHSEFVRSIHDYGTKTFLGRQGRFDGDDIIDLIVERRECHEFMARRFWLRYAGSAASPTAIAELADAFGRRRRVDDLLRTLFTMDAFYAPGVQQGLVSQPFEVLVRAIRGFELPMVDVERNPYDGDDEDHDRVLPSWLIPTLSGAMGQELGLPPNVAGWPHNAAWLDSNRSAGRLLAGIELGQTIAWIDTPVAEQLRSLSNAPDLLAAELLTRFGVVNHSPDTVAAIRASTTSDPVESVAAAFAVAFTSPEVVLA